MSRYLFVAFRILSQFIEAVFLAARLGAWLKLARGCQIFPAGKVCHAQRSIISFTIDSVSSEKQFRLESRDGSTFTKHPPLDLVGERLAKGLPG